MRKCLIVSLLLISAMSISQVTLQPGLKGGVNVSKINGIKSDGKTDFYLGGILSLNLSKFYTLQPELVYTRQGGENIYKREQIYNPTINQYEDVDFYEDINLAYLSISITNKFYITPKTNFYLLIAPSLDILVDNNIDYEWGGGYYIANNEIIPIDMTASLGAGYEFPFGLGFEARYKIGMINVLDSIFSDVNTKNRVFQVGLTYSFFSGK